MYVQNNGKSLKFWAWSYDLPAHHAGRCQEWSPCLSATPPVFVLRLTANPQICFLAAHYEGAKRMLPIDGASGSLPSREMEPGKFSAPTHVSLLVLISRPYMHRINLILNPSSPPATSARSWAHLKGPVPNLRAPPPSKLLNFDNLWFFLTPNLHSSLFSIGSVMTGP